MIEQLTDNVNFWVVLAFILAFWVGFKFGKKPVLGALDARTQRIKDELEEAEKLRIEAQEMLAMYQHKHRDAMKEADQIITNAQVQANKARERATQNLKETIDRLEEQAKNRIQMVQEEAEHEIREEIVSKARALATAEIEKKLTDKKKKDLIEQSIENIVKNTAL